MNISLAGRLAPSACFEVPLDMLAACYLRIAQQCSTLRRLVPHLAVHGADTQAREAAASVIRYFETAAKDHHADEENDLFPVLIESMAGSDAVCLRDMTSALAAEHLELEARWRHLRAVLERIVASTSDTLDAAEVEAFAGSYERHIEREKRELLPMAARLLTEDELARIGRAMRNRRGIAAVS
ncbi:MAG: hemerythrin domain-containing protein [Caldimonas sp.]